MYQEFDLHIDAALLSFRFVEAVYIRVTYITFNTMGSIDVGVTSLSMSPVIAESITNWPEISRQALEGSKANAQYFWMNQKLEAA